MIMMVIISEQELLAYDCVPQRCAPRIALIITSDTQALLVVFAEKIVLPRKHLAATLTNGSILNK